MLNIIQYDKIKKYKLYIPFDTNSNSILYFEKNIIHKIPNHINNDLEQVLNYVHDLDINEIIELKNLIYKDNSIKGYSFIKYKNYKSLNYYKYRDLKLKKEDCHKIYNLFQKLNHQNLKYGDFHTGNILLNKDNNIKLCDLDSLKFMKDDIFKLEQLRSTIVLCLSYLYNINVTDMLVLLRSSSTINNNRLINEIYMKPSDEFNDLLEMINLNNIKNERPFLKSKVKGLIQTGYYTKYYL